MNYLIYFRNNRSLNLCQINLTSDSHEVISSQFHKKYSDDRTEHSFGANNAFMLDDRKLDVILIYVLTNRHDRNMDDRTEYLFDANNSSILDLPKTCPTRYLIDPKTIIPVVNNKSFSICENRMVICLSNRYMFVPRAVMCWATQARHNIGVRIYSMMCDNQFNHSLSHNQLFNKTSRTHESHIANSYNNQAIQSWHRQIAIAKNIETTTNLLSPTPGSFSQCLAYPNVEPSLQNLRQSCQKAKTRSLRSSCNDAESPINSNDILPILSTISQQTSALFNQEFIKTKNLQNFV